MIIMYSNYILHLCIILMHSISVLHVGAIMYIY